MSKCRDWGTPHDHSHGTTSGWSYHGCRCAECRAVHYAYHRAADGRRSKPERRLRSREYSRRRHLADPEWRAREYAGRAKPDRQRLREATREHRKSNSAIINRRSLDRSRSIRESLGIKSGQRRWWSPAEDRIIQRDDISIKEMAFMVRRTPASITARRSRLSRGAVIHPHHSDTECRIGHSRSEHGRLNKKGWWVCRECCRNGKTRYRARLKLALSA